MLEYDITIIGAGPAGYVAAIKAGQEGYKTLCIDKRDVYGGTCLNVGCIPSKVLLEATHSYAELNYVNKYGIVINSVSLDLDKLMQYKNSVIHDLNHGIQHLFKKYKVDFIGDQAEILDANHINLVKTNQKIFSKNIIIATGSVPATIPGITIDEKTIVSSTGALNLNKIPNKMVVIGAGVIGLEMASIWSRLGSQVTIIEYSDMILGGLVDKDVSDTIKKIMPDINFIMNAKVTAVHNSIPLQITYEQDNQLYTIDNCDIVLVAVGRKPNISGLGLEKIGITLNKDGTVMVKNFQTNLPSIYAIGDVIPGPMLAHKASQDGIAVIDIIKNKIPYVNYNLVPSVIYTAPEIAFVGKIEKELSDYKIDKFPFRANSRAKIIDDTKGFVKIIKDNNDKILGGVIINNRAGDMIHELVVAMTFEASAEDLSLISHAHPTCSEAIKELFKPTHW